jgi:Ca2+-binding RTX toxin-like protein
MAKTSPYEAAALVLDLSNTYQKNLDQLGWNGTQQISTYYEQSITNLSIKQAFIDTGYIVFTPTDGDGSINNDLMTSNQNANYLWGGSGDDIVDGQGGDDRLFGANGNDLLYGRAGNDRLDGGENDDWLIGGTGNDELNGGNGDDTFVFNIGDGQDKINDLSTGADTVLFNGIKSTDIKITRNGNNSLIDYGTTDKLTFGLSDRFTANFNVKFKFSDGVTWNYSDFASRIIWRVCQ